MQEQESVPQTQLTARGGRIEWRKLAIVLALVAAVTTIAILIHVNSDLRSTNGSLKADLNETRQSMLDKAKAIAATKVIAERKGTAEAAKQQAGTKPVVDASPNVRGTFGVVIGTLYLPGQRKLFKEESAAALVTCSDSDTTLELVLAETGNTKRSRHETKAMAAAKQGMTDTEAQAKSACLHENLPRVIKRNSDGSVVNGDDGKPLMVKVVTEVVDGTKGLLAKAPVVHAEE